MHDAEPNERSSTTTAVQDGARFLRRRYPRILLTSVVSAILALAISQSLEPRYRSTAELLIESVPLNDPAETQALNAMDESSFVDGQVLVLQSSDLLKRVLADPVLLNDPEIAGTGEPSLTDRVKGVLVSWAEASGLAEEPDAGTGEEEDPVYDAIQRLRNMISVLREGRSTVITVSVTANEPRKAARIANAIVESYIDRQGEVQSQRAEQIGARLNNRLSDLRQQLLAAEQAVEAYKAEHGLLSTGVGTLSEQQMSDLNTQLVQTRADLYQKQATLDRAQDILRSGGDVYSMRDLMDSQLLADLRLRFMDATSRENDLVQRLGESSPALDQVRAEKADLQAQINAEIERLVEMLSNELQVTKAREALLVAALQQAGQQVSSEGEGQVELRELERVAEAYATQYQRLLDRAGNVNDLVGSASGDVRVISPAVAANSPYFPPDKMIVALGLILGAGLGLLWALARESMNTGIVTSQQAEAVLGAPVLATIPRTREAHAPRSHLLKEADSSFAESIRTLRHLLLAGARTDTAPALLVTSSVFGEGKTTIAMSLALSAALGGQRVLLVDGDLRQRALTDRFGMRTGPGLTEALAEPSMAEQVVQRDEATGIFVLPAGGPAASPPDLLESDRMRRMLDWARSSFDLVILDSPDVGNRVDSIILGRQCDLILFLVKWSSTPAEIAAECMDRLDSSKVRGVAINAVNEHEAASYGDNNARFARIRGRVGSGRGNPLRA